MSTAGDIASRGFWLRTRAMLIKEFIQLRRDRVSFAMIERPTSLVSCSSTAVGRLRGVVLIA